MSERLYGRYSSDILVNLSEDSVQNHTELKYLQEYTSLLHEYLQLAGRVRIYKDSNFFKSSLNDEITKRDQAKHRLSVLESSQPIQDILNRERQDGEEITMEYALSSFTKCPECNKEVSKKAITCPHCGFPIRKVANMDRLKKAPKDAFIKTKKGGMAFWGKLKSLYSKFKDSTIFIVLSTILFLMLGFCVLFLVIWLLDVLFAFNEEIGIAVICILLVVVVVVGIYLRFGGKDNITKL